MTEHKLKEYFENELRAEEFALDLKNSQQKTGYDVTTVYVGSIDEGAFEVRKEHLIRLLDDTASEKISLKDLNTIGFVLMTSDYFYYDPETLEGERMNTVIFELDNPSIGHDLTIKNVLLWKEYLLTGAYRLDKNELKQKFRSKGKYKELYQQVDEVLWYKWDPMGVNDTAIRDKYQSYTPAIFNLVKKGADKDAIAHKLFEFETQNMGLSGNMEHCKQVADKLLELNSK